LELILAVDEDRAADGGWSYCCCDTDHMFCWLIVSDFALLSDNGLTENGLVWMDVGVNPELGMIPSLILRFKLLLLL